MLPLSAPEGPGVAWWVIQSYVALDGIEAGASHLTVVVPLRDSSIPTSFVERFLLLEWLAAPDGGHGVVAGLSSSLDVTSLRSSLAAWALAFLLRLASGCGIILARIGGWGCSPPAVPSSRLDSVPFWIGGAVTVASAGLDMTALA